MSLNEPRTTSDETGAILPIVGLVILILLVFAAFAVDFGAAWAERREAQTAADSGVMGAALQYLVAPPDEDGIYDLVSTYSNANISGPGFTFDNWDSCVDPDRPAGYAPLGSSGTWDSAENGGGLDLIDCISIKQAGAEPAVLRVRMPEQDMPTAFAKLIGIDTISVTAFAEAEILITEASDILPFSLPADPSAEECLGTPPSGQLPPDNAPCTGPVSGNFGMLDVWWFGADNETHDTLSDGCPSKPPFTKRTPYNLSVGIDHPITEWPRDPDDPNAPYIGPGIGVNLPNIHPAAEVCENAGTDVIPYVIQTETGNTVTVLEDGFFGVPQFGTANLPGRLRQIAPIDDRITATISDEDDRLAFNENSGSYTVDNLGMWEYLDQTFIDATSECHTNAFTVVSGSTGLPLAGRELTDQMETCLGSGDAEFIDEILDSPRFAIVPKMNYVDGAQAGTQWWAIMEMVPIYVQATWFECKAPTADCLFEPTGFDLSGDADGKSVFFHPGEGSTPPCLPKAGGCQVPGTISAMGVSAFVIDSAWLSNEANNSLGKPQPYEVYLKR